MFCLSKGLCAPVGSMLAGPSDFIDAARRKRKIMGGGPAAGGHPRRGGPHRPGRDDGRASAEDHENASELARLLAAIPGVTRRPRVGGDQHGLLQAERRRATPELFAERLVAAMRERGILINPPDKGEFRFVTHYWIDRARVQATAKAFAEALAHARQGRGLNSRERKAISPVRGNADRRLPRSPIALLRYTIWIY